MNIFSYEIQRKYILFVLINEVQRNRLSELSNAFAYRMKGHNSETDQLHSYPYEEKGFLVVFASTVLIRSIELDRKWTTKN